MFNRDAELERARNEIRRLRAAIGKMRDKAYSLADPWALDGGRGYFEIADMGKAALLAEPIDAASPG